MSKYIQRFMFVVLLLSLATALGAIFNLSFELAIGSLTFTFGLFILVLGYVNPLTINSRKNLAVAVASALSIGCFSFLPLTEAVMISGWVWISLLLSVDTMVTNYE